MAVARVKRVVAFSSVHNAISKERTSSSLSAEMVSSMKAVASLDVELTVEERNLLSVAYKNVIGARRASWRIVSSIEQKEENKAAEDKLKLIRTYREKVSAIIASNFPRELQGDPSLHKISYYILFLLIWYFEWLPNCA